MKNLLCFFNVVWFNISSCGFSILPWSSFRCWSVVERIPDIVFSWLALLPIPSAAVLNVANALRLQVPDVVWNPIEFRETFWSTWKSDLQRELVRNCLMWKAQQNNFCFCYFAERFVLKAKIRFSERLCVTWFSLVKIVFVFAGFASVYYVSIFAFSQHQSEKANWSMNST